LQLGTIIRDDLVSLALEFYLGVIEQEDEDDDEDFEDQDDPDNVDPVPSKPKKGKKADEAKAKEECKQQ